MKGGKSDEVKTAPTRTFQMPGKPGMKGGGMKGGGRLQGKRDETCGTKGSGGGGYDKC